MRRSLMLCALAAFFLTVSCSRDSSVVLGGEPLRALSAAAKSGSLQAKGRGDTLFYEFTESQSDGFSALSAGRSGASLVVRLRKEELPVRETVTFYAGFLYASDFLDEHKLYAELGARSEVSGVLSDEQLPVVDVAMSVGRGDEVPLGFFVKGEPGLRVDSVRFEGAMLGFDRSPGVPLYAFGPDGGGIELTGSGADFSAAEKLFPRADAQGGGLPRIIIKKAHTSDIGSSDSQLTVRGTYSGEDFAIRCSPESDTYTFQTAAFMQPYGELSFRTHGELVVSALLRAPDAAPSYGSVTEPLVSDIGLVIGYPPRNWRTKEYELFRWEEFPSVLVFDTIDYDTQNQFFTRLAYFVEKQGYKGTFVSDAFILTEHGYNAHDYKAEDLARFFSRAEAEGVRLNDHELLLREILLKNGVILSGEGNSYAPGSGSVISFSQESAQDLRYQLVAHEGWHGIYFGDEDFRDTVAVAYLMFDPVSLDFLQTYWATYESLMYDRNDDYLMRNEFMAYLLQRPVSQIAEYFTTRAKWNSVQRTQKANADYVVATDAEAFVDASALLNGYVFSRWGLAAGRVWNISR